jgi:hypothetical protein
MQVQGGGNRVRLFRLEIDIAEVANAVTDQVVHDGSHRPGIALAEVGRAHLARHAEFEVAIGVRRAAGERCQLPVVVGTFAVLGVARGGILLLVVHHHSHAIRVLVVAPNIASVRLDPFIARTEQGQPLRVDARLLLAEQPEAVARAIVDVVEGAGPHHRT